MVGKTRMASIVVVALAFVISASAQTAFCDEAQQIAGITGTNSNGTVCCVEACGACGGVGCGNQTDTTLEASDCCTTDIWDSDVFCDDSPSAPCIVPETSETSTCPNGMDGFQDGAVCCPQSCGGCGGAGCGANGAGQNCCSVSITQTNKTCNEDEDIFAPCVMAEGTYTSSPSSGPLLEASNTPSLAPSFYATGFPEVDPDDIDATFAPSSSSRGILPGTTGTPTSAPTGIVSTENPTTTSGAPFIPSPGSVTTMAALAAGAFAMMAAARE